MKPHHHSNLSKESGGSLTQLLPLLHWGQTATSCPDQKIDRVLSEMVTKLHQLSIQTLRGVEEKLCTEKLEEQILYTSSPHVLTVFQQLLYSNIYNLSLYASLLCFIIKRVHKFQLPLQSKLLYVISHVQHKALLEKQFVFIFPLLNQYFKYLWKPYTSLASHHL